MFKIAVYLTATEKGRKAARGGKRGGDRKGSLPITHHERAPGAVRGGKTKEGLVLVGVKSKTSITTALCERTVQFREGNSMVPQGIMYRVQRVHQSTARP